MVGTIRQTDPLLNFEGYANKEDTNKKIIRNVFQRDDMVFTSGDILYWVKFYDLRILQLLMFRTNLVICISKTDVETLSVGVVKMLQQLRLNQFFNQFLQSKMQLFMVLK